MPTRVSAWRLALVTLILGLPFGTAPAAEGMWTLDHLPLTQMKAQYGFSPDAKWADHAEHSAVRLAGGCSGSFISADGLVLTNHHCVRACVQQISTAEKNFVADGFYAKSEADEKLCPTIELNRLDTITDVTAEVKKATDGLAGADYSKAQRAVKSKIEADCAAGNEKINVCEVVTLYHGGIYDLYKYHRFQDVRLVFAPEEAMAFFGGDPDNFNYPRYDLDMGMLRAYEDGKPAKVKDFFPFSRNGAAAGEMTMVLGHPGSTQRQLTVSQLETQRDVDLPSLLWRYSELRGLLTQYSSESPEAGRTSRDDLFGIENGLKARKGAFEALIDPEVFTYKRRQETELRDYVNADPVLKAADGDAWDQIAAAQNSYRTFETAYKMVGRTGGFFSDEFSFALSLVRAAAERTKPNSERLPEYTDAALPRMTQRMFSNAPVYPELEKVTLGFSLTKLREYLGADDAFVHRILGKEAPSAMATRLVDGSKLNDPAVRKQLWEGGQTAIDASTDPMILLAKQVDPDARALRKRWEDEVEAVEKKNAERIAEANFRRYGTDVYPDATFTLRLSYGEVKGWDEKGKPVAPFTDIAGAFDRATGAEPFALPESWLGAKEKLDGKTHLDFVTDNDIIGGNSGSPVINRDGEVVGLIFDGNIESLGGAFWFDPRYNRSVAVSTTAIVEALSKVYKADRIVKELKKGRV